MVWPKSVWVTPKWSFWRAIPAVVRHMGPIKPGMRGWWTIAPMPVSPALVARHAGGHGPAPGNHEKTIYIRRGPNVRKRCDDAATRGCDTRLQSLMVVLE